MRKWLIQKLLGVPKGALLGVVQIEEWAIYKKPMEDIKRCVHSECSALEFDLLEEIKRLRKEHK